MNARIIGKIIKLLRVYHNMNQSELAKKSKTYQKSISLYECGKRLPSLNTLQKIAGALNVPMSHFLE